MTFENFQPHKKNLLFGRLYRFQVSRLFKFRLKNKGFMKQITEKVDKF